MELIRDSGHQGTTSHETDSRIKEAAKRRLGKTLERAAQATRQIVDASANRVEHVRCRDHLRNLDRFESLQQLIAACRFPSRS
jgi:hypothetical protein